MKKIDYSLGEDIVAFTTLKDDCGDNNPFGGFNPCDYVGDVPEHVSECRKALSDYLNISPENLIIPRQIHSATVETIDNLIISTSSEIDGIDAMVTDIPGKALVIHTADCVPVLFADSTARVVAAAHGGWRGLTGGILENTVATMINYGAKPKRIKAVIGPHISHNYFEVGQDVISYFADSEVEVRDGKFYVDLSKVALNRLERVGLTRENINIVDRCTFAETENFFSARRQGKECGRMASVIMLKS